MKSVLKSTYLRNIKNGYWVEHRAPVLGQALVRLTQDMRGCNAGKAGDLMIVSIHLSQAEIAKQRDEENAAALARIQAQNNA